MAARPGLESSDCHMIASLWLLLRLAISSVHTTKIMALNGHRHSTESVSLALSTDHHNLNSALMNEPGSTRVSDHHATLLT